MNTPDNTTDNQNGGKKIMVVVPVPNIHTHQLTQLSQQHQPLIPPQFTPQFNFREKDNQFNTILDIIENKRNYLQQKQSKLRRMARQNEYLDGIKNDYNKYNSYILKQKHDQMRALNTLNHYIGELNKMGELTEQNMADSKIEQNKILQEIDKIRNTLDEITAE